MTADRTDASESRPTGCNAAQASHRRRWTIRAVVRDWRCYLLFAYLFLPALWHHYEHQPNLADAPKVTRHAQRHSGRSVERGPGRLEGRSRAGDARRRLASGRRGHGAVAACILPKASAGSQVRRCPGQQSVSLGAQAGSGLRATRGKKCPRAAPRAILEKRSARRGWSADMAGRRHVRSQRRFQPSHRVRSRITSIPTSIRTGQRLEQLDRRARAGRERIR